MTKAGDRVEFGDMGVARISARQLKNGRIGVSIELPRAAWAALQQAAARGSHPNTADYLAGIINMLVLEGV